MPRKRGPLRTVRKTSARGLAGATSKPARSSKSPQGFDFTAHMRALCRDMSQRLDELRHINMDLVAMRFCQARRNVRHGLQATLTPLRFEQGASIAVKCGRQWTVETLRDAGGHEMLYLLSFYLPRYQNHSLLEKLSIAIHELWHISPAFDGDLRRHPGRCYAHTHSQAEYDAHARRLAERWLSLGPPLESYDFLQHDFRQLEQQRGPIFGMRIRTPRLIEVGRQSA